LSRFDRQLFLTGITVLVGQKSVVAGASVLVLQLRISVMVLVSNHCINLGFGPSPAGPALFTKSLLTVNGVYQ